MPRMTHLYMLVAVQTVVSAASLIVEIVAGRMLAPHVGMSLYTWTSIIAVVLAGFSAGHWIGGRLAENDNARALHMTGWALVAAALFTAVATGLLRFTAAPVLAWFDHPIWGIVVLSLIVFFPPSLFAGVPSPVLAKIAVTAPGRQGHALGAIFAAGAIGAIAGTLLAGFLFISWLGSTATLAAVTLSYVLCALACFWMAGSTKLLAPIIASVIALIIGGSALALPQQCDEESQYFCIRSVDVSANPENPVRLMVIDHLAHGITARDLPHVMFTEHAALLAALARLRAPEDGFSSFFIGGGTYSIPRSFAQLGTGPITVAEIDPEVTAIAARDFWFDPATATILHQDARRALLVNETRYDVIVGDAFTDVAVPSHLITKEFFELAKSRLTADGTFLINVIDYEGRLDALASITRTLQQVFPVVEIWRDTAATEPDQRMVFVLSAGNTPSPIGRFTIPTPEPVQFGVLADSFTTRLAEAKGIVLTDDFVPIDRLIGVPD